MAAERPGLDVIEVYVLCIKFPHCCINVNNETFSSFKYLQYIMSIYIWFPTFRLFLFIPPHIHYAAGSEQDRSELKGGSPQRKHP